MLRRSAASSNLRGVQLRADPLGVTEDDLCLAVVDYSMRHTVRSIRSYMSAIQALWDEEEIGQLPRGARYLATVAGLNRLLGAADVVVRSRAVSVQEILTIIDSLDPVAQRTAGLFCK
jgi:hypothetical protein